MIKQYRVKLGYTQTTLFFEPDTINIRTIHIPEVTGTKDRYLQNQYTSGVVVFSGLSNYNGRKLQRELHDHQTSIEVGAYDENNNLTPLHRFEQCQRADLQLHPLPDCISVSFMGYDGIELQGVKP